MLDEETEAQVWLELCPMSQCPYGKWDDNKTGVCSDFPDIKPTNGQGFLELRVETRALHVKQGLNH